MKNLLFTLATLITLGFGGCTQEIVIPHQTIVFLGDSRFAVSNPYWRYRYGTPPGIWETGEIFVNHLQQPGDTIINYAVTGDATVSTRLYWIQPTLDLHPTKVFISVGGNDLGYHLTEVPDTNWVMLLDAFRNQKVIVMGLMYFSELKTIQSGTTKLRVDTFNDSLQRLVGKYSNATFFKLSNAFYDAQGWLKSDYTFDGVHQNNQGYLMMCDELRKYIYY